MRIRTFFFITAIGALLLQASAPVTLSAGLEELSGRVELPERKATEGWGKDPFVPLVREVALADLRLKAVFFNVTNPSAIINNSIVYRGDTVDGQKVVDIGKTHVILQGAGGTIRLDIAGVPEKDARKGGNP